MDRKILNKNKLLIAKVFTLIFFIMLIIFSLRLSYLCLSGKIDGIDLKSFSEKRNTKEEVLYALRGNIYDSNNNILAQTINSYTLIAYLDEKRSEGYDTPKHVVDKELTSQKLSEVLGISKESILKNLNKKAYQVEFGSKAKGLTELQKEQIESLNLPGLDFITTHKRYYPNNTFLSYVIGYSKDKEDGTTIGEMGIEKKYNDIMTGTNGFVKYQKDLNGYKFPNSNEIRKEKVDGNDVYLTIDSNVQMTLEKVIQKANEDATPDWIVAAVMDAKTGAILGSATAPTFNPNTKDISNYLNPLVSYTYEPGSVMKTYSYMATLDTNSSFDPYNLNCYTAPYEIGEYTVRDWNKTGWGEISYAKGYSLSSNTCVANMVKNYVKKDTLKSYYKKLGFSEKTNVDLPDEYSGKVNFKYDIEVVNAAFGQGITTTAIQQLKALTSIANNGYVLTPYIVDKTVNSETNEVTYKATVKKGEKVANEKTINILKDLMWNVTNSDQTQSTGYNYRLDGYDLIGKTGTAEIANPKTGKYYTGMYDYITSFAGMYPKNDPQVIVYVAFQRSHDTKVLSETVKTIVKETAKYLKVYNEIPDLNKEVSIYKVDNYKGKDKNEAVTALNNISANYIIIGDGNIITYQYPKSGQQVNTKQKVLLFTNQDVIKMPNLVGLSVKEAKIILDKLGIKYESEVEGYIKEQSIKEQTIVNDDMIVNLK